MQSIWQIKPSKLSVCLIDSPIPKTAGLAGLEGLLNFLLQKAEGLADFEEILVFICETFENEANLLALLR